MEIETRRVHILTVAAVIALGVVLSLALYV
jgi:hypothetical protein